MLLHHADQGALQPEVRRSRQAVRRGQGRSADRRQQRQLRGAGGRDDHRGPAEHAVRGLPVALRARLCGHGRGALPLRPFPGRGVGGSDHPPAGVGDAGLPVGDRLQRGGVRRLAGHRARRHRGDRLRAPPGAALAARDGRPQDVRPLRGGDRPRRPGRRTPRGQPGPGPPRPAGEPEHLQPARPPPGQDGARGRPRARAAPAQPDLDAGPPRGHRPAGQRGPAARHHLHLQPGRLRGRRTAVPVRRTPPQRRGQTPAGPRDRRGAHRLHPRRGPARPGLLRMARRAGAGHRRAPRGHAPDLQGGRRGAVRQGAGEGRLRHRDPCARHQHARALRGVGEARQVERRAARRHHPRRVHPAHRPGRASRHRCRGPCGGPVAARHGPDGAGRPRRDAYVSAALQLPPLVQHGGQPGAAVRAAPLAGAAGDLVRPVPGRQVGRRDLAAGPAQRGGPGGLQGGHDLPPRRLRGVRAAAPRPQGPGDGAGQAGGGAAAGGGGLLAGEAEARRHHPCADGEVRGSGAGAGPGPARRAGQRAPRVRPPRRAASAGADRRAAGQAAGLDGLPGAGRGAGPDARPEVVQRALAAVPARSGLRAAVQGRAHRARPAPQGAGAGRRRPGDRPAADRAARPPVPRVRRAGGPRAVGRALPPAAARHPAAGETDRGADEHDRPDLRPDRRAPDRDGLSPGQRGHGERAAAGPAVRGAGPARQRVSAGGGLGRAQPRRTGGLRLGVGVRGAAGR
ncbi:hypothetical protein SFIMM107S_04760 [Streptomyces griseus]